MHTIETVEIKIDLSSKIILKYKLLSNIMVPNYFWYKNKERNKKYFYV